MSKKISELDPAGALTGNELVEIVQSGASVQATTQDIADLAGSGISGLTTGRLPKAASATTLDDSVVHQSSSNIGIGTTSPDRKFHVENDSATTNAVTYVQRLTSTSSGTPAIGIGVGLEFEVETSANNNEVGATIEAITTDVNAGSEDFDLSIKQMQGGAAAIETLRITPNAGSGTITYTLGSGASGTVREIVAGATGSNSTLTISSKGNGGIALIGPNGQVAGSGQGVEISTASEISLFAQGSIPVVSRKNTATTSTVESVHRFERTTSGSPANGIGVRAEFQVETSGGNNEIGATIDAVVIDNAGSSEDFDMVFNTMAGGLTAAERLRLSDAGAEIPSTAAYYLGARNTNGTWRFILSGDDLLVQQREAGSYVTKHTFSGA